MRITLALLICWATSAASQDSSIYMDRAVGALRAALAPIAAWEETRSTDQVVFQCRDCDGQVVVVLRHMTNYAKGSGFPTPQALYSAGRKQLCSDLVAQRRGRCLDANRSLEGDKLVYEWVSTEGPHLHAGYLSAPQNAAEIDAIVPILHDAVKRLSALW